MTADQDRTTLPDLTLLDTVQTNTAESTSQDSKQTWLARKPTDSSATIRNNPNLPRTKRLPPIKYSCQLCLTIFPFPPKK